MQGLAKQSVIVIMDNEKAIQQKVDDILNDYNKGGNSLMLPSRCQVNQVVHVQWRPRDEPIVATVRGVRFYVGKVKYDVGLWLGDGSVDDPEKEERIYNVDSVFVTPI